MLEVPAKIHCRRCYGQAWHHQRNPRAEGASTAQNDVTTIAENPAAIEGNLAAIEGSQVANVSTATEILIVTGAENVESISDESRRRPIKQEGVKRQELAAHTKIAHVHLQMGQSFATAAIGRDTSQTIAERTQWRTASPYSPRVAVSHHQTEGVATREVDGGKGEEPTALTSRDSTALPSGTKIRQTIRGPVCLH